MRATQLGFSAPAGVAKAARAVLDVPAAEAARVGAPKRNGPPPAPHAKMGAFKRRRVAIRAPPGAGTSSGKQTAQNENRSSEQGSAECAKRLNKVSKTV